MSQRLDATYDHNWQNSMDISMETLSEILVSGVPFTSVKD
jgi:hypothetical protein